jgi:glycosyltransferase involved in cell wall biosynthesis
MINKLPIFFSLVITVHNQAGEIKPLLTNTSSLLENLVMDYEIIIIDNASTDHSLSYLKELATLSGLPNLQIYALTREVDSDTASWVGVENALGDFIAVVDPFADSISFLAKMLEKAMTGFDVVYAKNELISPQKLIYKVAYSIFNIIYRLSSGINLANEMPQFKLFSRRVVNFILQHPRPVIAYRHLPITGGFSRVILHYSATPKSFYDKKLGEGFYRGMRLLFSTTRLPMRLVTSLSLFGASANFLYAIYVISVGFFKTDVAPGWVTLSLQQSGMFFLMSIVLFVLGEYILQMVTLSNEGPSYHVAQEFNSARITRNEKLNIEEVNSKS